MDIQEKEEYTTVYLRRRKTNTTHLFYCHHCSRPLFKYAGSVALVTPGNGGDLMKAPFEHKCPGKMRSESGDKKCPIIYVIEGFVEIVS